MKPILVALMVAPYILNDFLYHAFQEDFPKFIAIVYLTAIIALLIAFYALRKGILNTDEFGLSPISGRAFVTWSIILSVVGIFVDRNVGVFLYSYMKHLIYFKFPLYPNDFWRWLDLTLGLTIGVVAEEVVFRGALLTALRSRLPTFAAASISLALFAASHWGSGVHSVLNSFVWAIIPTLFVLRYKSIYPPIFAHFATDFVTFYLH